MLTSEVLNTAADLIEERGWIGQPDFPLAAWGLDSSSTPLCLEGGILAAIGGTSTADLEGCPANAAVLDYLELGRYGRAYNWNDQDNRTAAEVIEVLRACALLELAKENSSLGAAALV